MNESIPKLPSDKPVRVYIDRDCTMCQRFGQKLAGEGFEVVPRASNPAASIEVQKADGRVLSGYYAMVEIARQRGILSDWLARLLNTRLFAVPGQVGYRLIANNRKLISKFLAQR